MVDVELVLSNPLGFLVNKVVKKLGILKHLVIFSHSSGR